MLMQEEREQIVEYGKKMSADRLTSGTNTGISISIRKTPPLIRLTAESAIAEKFCSEELLAVLINCN